MARGRDHGSRASSAASGASLAARRGDRTRRRAGERRSAASCSGRCPPLVIAALVIARDRLGARASRRDPSLLVAARDHVRRSICCPGTSGGLRLAVDRARARGPLPVPHPAGDYQTSCSSFPSSTAFPSMDTMVVMVDLRDDGHRPEHGRRLRGTARPRLRRLLRARRVHGGVARVAALRRQITARLLARRRSACRPGSAGSTSRSGSSLLIAAALTAVGGHPHRPADAAAARRLPRDRHARLRRDPPAGRANGDKDGLRLQPHERPARDQPDRPAGLRQLAFDAPRACRPTSLAKQGST